MRITALRMAPVWIVRCCWTVVLIWGGPAPGDTGLGLWTSVVVTTRGAPGIEWVGAREAAQPHSARAASHRPETRPAPNAHRAEGRPRCLVSCLARTGASRHVSRLSVCLSVDHGFTLISQNSSARPLHPPSRAWAPATHSAAIGRAPPGCHSPLRGCTPLPGAARRSRGFLRQRPCSGATRPPGFPPPPRSFHKSRVPAGQHMLSLASSSPRFHIILSSLGAVTGAPCALNTSRSIL